MAIRRIGLAFLVISIVALCRVLPVIAQGTGSQRTANAQATSRTSSQTASSVSAELVKGKLNPAKSKPGDQVELRLNEDVKSNGQVVLKKGSTITGVVRSVKRLDGKSESSSSSSSKSQGTAQSMMQIEWLTPVAKGAVSEQLTFALQSLSYTNPLFAHQQHEESALGAADLARPIPSGGAPRQGPSGGLLGGVSGAASSTLGAVGAVGGVGAGATSAVGVATETAVAPITGGGAIGRSNASLLAMPSVMPVDSQTGAALQNNFGVSNDRLSVVGHGRIISAGGSNDSVDLFSHFSNDTIITSPSKDFEVASGAEMRLLVGVQK